MLVAGATCKDWTKAHAAPTAELSSGPPKIAVLPSPESATELPRWADPTASELSSFDACWVQAPLLRMNTHTAPTPLLPDPLSKGPPSIAVLPSPDSATDQPWFPKDTPPVPASLAPCSVQL